MSIAIAAGTLAAARRTAAASIAIAAGTLAATRGTAAVAATCTALTAALVFSSIGAAVGGIRAVLFLASVALVASRRLISVGNSLTRVVADPVAILINVLWVFLGSVFRGSCRVGTARENEQR